MKPDAPKEIRGEFKPSDQRTRYSGLRAPSVHRKAGGQVHHPALHEIQGEQPRARNQLSAYRLPAALDHRVPQHGRRDFERERSQERAASLRGASNTFPSYGGGYLGGEYNPFLSGDPNVSGYKVRDLTLPTDVDWRRVGDRNYLLKQMDAKFKAIDSNGDFGAMDAFYQRAYDLMKSPAAKKAFDIESEPAPLREKYGRTPVGQGCLLARRLGRGRRPFREQSAKGLAQLRHARRQLQTR